MKQKLARFILYRLAGWKIIGEIPERSSFPRLLFVMLPHTSNWDFIVGMLLLWAEKLDITLFGKNQFYFFPFTYLYRYFGVVPIERSVSNNFVERAAARYADGQALWTAMAPEGTRSYREHLKSGYYFFAKKANLPIVTVGFDFSRKKIVILPPRNSLDSFEQDAQTLIEFSRTMVGKRPELAI